MALTVLIVEDDSGIRRGLADALRFGGFTVLEAADGPAAMTLLEGGGLDLVLLDVMLPKGVDGYSILRTIRDRSATLPVIMLTARGSESDRVEGLNAGADDYVVKPFSARELLARVDAVLRRSPQRSSPATGVRRGEVEVCLRRREIRRRGAMVEAISERDAAILEYLAAHRGRAVHRDELLRAAWGLDPRGLETRTVDMQIARLREKLAPAEVVATVRGTGYMLAEGVEVMGSQPVLH